MSEDQNTLSVDERTRLLINEFHLHHIKILEGEQILEVTSDHYMEWLPRIIPPIALALICFVVAFMRASGYSFFVFGPRPDSAIDPLNVFLMLIFFFVFISWLVAPSGKSQQSEPPNQLSRILRVLAVVAILALVTFRVQGGLIYTSEAFAQRANVTFFDLPNIILMLVALLCIAVTFYMYIESENDHLILTTHRVILSDKELWGNYQVDQIILEDIQNVISKSRTYLEYWLNYGKITVQSTRKSLEFRGAERAREVQARIMKEVNGIRNRQVDYNYREMIEGSVYGKKSDKRSVDVKLRVTRSSTLFRAILPDNPRHEPNGSIIWYPHWIYLFQYLVQPVLALILSIIIVVITAQAGLLTSGLLVGITLLALLGFGGWIAYQIEDYRNDLYILTPTNVIDVEKVPFGPEDRRTASLGALQNVTVQTSFISRIFNYGDVFLETAGAGKFTFHGVPNPTEVVRLINAYQDEYRRGDKERSLKDTLTLLKYYHDEQNRKGELIPDGLRPSASPDQS